MQKQQKQFGYLCSTRHFQLSSRKKEIPSPFPFFYSNYFLLKPRQKCCKKHRRHRRRRRRRCRRRRCRRRCCRPYKNFQRNLSEANLNVLF